MMEQNKSIILNYLIKEHIATALPVSSGILVEKYSLEYSPATVRQRMAELELDGFIIQPHTSSGRVPTEKAYRIFVENLPIIGLKSSENKLFSELLKNKSEQNLKQAAKALANLSGLAVFWAFHERNLYYTGISNLLKQPEFSRLSRIYDISAIIDQMDEIIDNSYRKISFGKHILIGSESPFGDFCSTILAKYKQGRQSGMFGIISPIRMDYAKNIALINNIYSYLK